MAQNQHSVKFGTEKRWHYWSRCAAHFCLRICRYNESL